MNYTTFFANGMNHVVNAGIAWDRRKCSLIKAWLEIKANEPSPKLERINRIIDVLDVRMRTLSNMIYEFKQHQERLKQEADHQIIMLFCPRFECISAPDGYATGVKLKDYVHGEHRCDRCGAVLELEEDRDVDFMLLELGISPT